MLGKIPEVLNIAVLTVACALAAGSGWLVLREPASAPPSAIRVEATAARLARGAFLYKLADCDGCHSERDFSHFGGPVMPGGRGKGNVLPRELGLPGRVVASNITPDPQTGIGAWSDGEKIRAIREGVSRDGRALFPLMPYQSYRSLSDEDVYSLVAYLNSLPPVRNLLPRTKLDFPTSLLIRGEPQPVGKVAAPDERDPAARGRYLAGVGGCTTCHGSNLAGGREFRFPFARVASANITPDAETGIGKWSERDFLERFHQYRDYQRNGSPAVGPEGFTVMPWLNLSGLPTEDLSAIFAFLRTQAPVFHPVDTHP